MHRMTPVSVVLRLRNPGVDQGRRRGVAQTHAASELQGQLGWCSFPEGARCFEEASFVAGSAVRFRVVEAGPTTGLCVMEGLWQLTGAA